MLILFINLTAALLWIGLLMKLDSSSNFKGDRNPYYLFFIAGIVSTAPAILLYQMLPWFESQWKHESWMVFVNYVFITGPVEELCKFSLFFILASKLKTIREPRDGMLQGASVGLGFAFTENFLYANEYGIGVLLARSILCISGHMIYASIWGIFSGRIIFENKKFIKRIHYPYIAFSVIIAALIHGLYNYFLSDDALILGAVMSLAINLLAIAASYNIYLKTGTESPYKLYPLREFNKAIHIISMALAHDPQNHILNKRIGLYYIYAGDYKSATEHFDLCVKIQPENFYCHAFSGVSLILSGKKENGINKINSSVNKISEKSMIALKKNIRAVIDDRKIRDEILGMFDN